MATPLGDYDPQENGIAICLECESINAFNADLTLREVPPEELEAIKKDDPSNWSQIVTVRAIVARVKAKEEKAREEG